MVSSVDLRLLCDGRRRRLVGVLAIEPPDDEGRFGRHSPTFVFTLVESFKKILLYMEKSKMSAQHENSSTSIDERWGVVQEEDLRLIDSTILESNRSTRKA
jgi:hypothetical protein